MNEVRPKFRRVLLKLSGEALTGKRSFGIDPRVLNEIAHEISTVHALGVQIAIVVGGGNIFRGLRSQEYGMRRIPADHAGMLATVINSLALAEALERKGMETRVMTAIDMTKIAEPYSSPKAATHLSRHRIVLFGAGTGNPYFTTDTAAALRAAEIEAKILLKATKVDGVYSADPQMDRGAKPFASLSYREVLKRHLKVMDLTAVSLAMEQGLPIIVFNLRKKGSILKAVSGKRVGTLISGGKP